jgi:hypothetical protein
LDAARAEIVVRGSGWTAGSVVLLVWLVTAAVAAAGPVSDGARLAILAVGPLFGVVAAWAATSRRVVVATPSALRVTRRPIGLWDVVRVARRDLSFLALESDRVNDAAAEAHADSWWGRRERWSVVARTRSGRTYTIATGYRDVGSAKRVVDQLSRVLGC